MVVLVDSVDFGAVTSGKVFSSMPLAKIKAGSPVFINRGSSVMLHLGYLSV